jgi:hypothetical protein
MDFEDIGFVDRSDPMEEPILGKMVLLDLFPTQQLAFVPPVN